MIIVFRLLRGVHNQLLLFCKSSTGVQYIDSSINTEKEHFEMVSLRHKKGIEDLSDSSKPQTAHHTDGFVVVACTHPLVASIPVTVVMQ